MKFMVFEDDRAPSTLAGFITFMKIPRFTKKAVSNLVLVIFTHQAQTYTKIRIEE